MPRWQVILAVLGADAVMRVRLRNIAWAGIAGFVAAALAEETIRERRRVASVIDETIRDLESRRDELIVKRQRMLDKEQDAIVVDNEGWPTT